MRGSPPARVVGQNQRNGDCRRTTRGRGPTVQRVDRQAGGSAMPGIYPTATVSNEATLAADVIVDAFTVIGPGVTIGAGSRVGPLTRIEGAVTIGERNHIIGQSSIGTPPQDLKFKGERTELVIANDNIIREFCTLNRGTAGGGGIETS